MQLTQDRAGCAWRGNVSLKLMNESNSGIFFSFSFVSMQRWHEAKAENSWSEHIYCENSNTCFTHEEWEKHKMPLLKDYMRQGQGWSMVLKLRWRLEEDHIVAVFFSIKVKIIKYSTSFRVFFEDTENIERNQGQINGTTNDQKQISTLWSMWSCNWSTNTDVYLIVSLFLNVLRQFELMLVKWW